MGLAIIFCSYAYIQHVLEINSVAMMVSVFHPMIDVTLSLIVMMKVMKITAVSKEWHNR